MIGLAGPLGSGKDTVATILREHGYHQLSYGKYIRQECEQGYMPPGVQVPDVVRRTITMMREQPKMRPLVWEKPTTPEVRQLLQWWGEWRFSINAAYWTRMMRDEIKSLAGLNRVVISDIRRPNEFNMVHEFHGENWRIERIQDESNPTRAHITETMLTHYNFSAYIDNNQDLVKLTHCVNDCLHQYDPEAFK